MSLTCLITSAAAASNHSEIVSSDSKYLLPFKIFLYLQSGVGGGGEIIYNQTFSYIYCF